METTESSVNERLDHLGVVAGVCEEIGLAAHLDRLASETNHYVSMGTATVLGSPYENMYQISS